MDSVYQPQATDASGVIDSDSLSDGDSDHSYEPFPPRADMTESKGYRDRLIECCANNSISEAMSLLSRHDKNDFVNYKNEALMNY
jgi:hypothetical protein